MTLRTTGSLAILDKAGRKHAVATCQIQSRNPANRGKVCNNVLGDFTHFASCKLSGHHCRPHKVLEDVLLECIRDAYTHQRTKATAQVVHTEDKRPTVYNNLHTSIPSTITGNTGMTYTGDIVDDDDTFGKFTQPDLLLVTNGILPSEEFPITSRSKPRPLHMNSLPNRDRQFQKFIAHCAENELKYEFFDVHFSHKDESSLETNERIKRNGYQKAFWDFAEKAQNPTHRHHLTLQLMKRLNHTREGEPKVTPFGVNIYGVLSKDAHKVLVRLAAIRFPETPHCLSYLSARQQWIDWYIRVFQKNVSEAVVAGIEAGFAHRARLAQDLVVSPRNTLRSPPQRLNIQIDKSTYTYSGGDGEKSTPTTPTTRTPAEAHLEESPGDEPNDHMSEYELQRLRNIRENEQYLQRLMAPKSPRPLETIGNKGNQWKVSHNNCGIHTIFYIMGHCRSGAQLAMSPSQIETHSIRIRAWLIKMIVEGLPEGTSWTQSLTAHIRTNMAVEKWFRLENFDKLQNAPVTNAISTIFPDRYLAGDAIQLAVTSLHFTIGPGAYLADVLVSHLPAEGLLRIIKKRIHLSSRDTFDKILIPINVESTHWYLGVLQRHQSGEYQLQTHNNCSGLINEQAESNLKAIGKALSRSARQLGVTDTPIKHEHRRKLNLLDGHGNSEITVQDGRSGQPKNKYSRCPPTKFTNRQDLEKFEPQSSSQSSEPIDYGTQPNAEIRSYEDYDWDQERMVQYRRNDNDGLHRF